MQDIAVLEGPEQMHIPASYTGVRDCLMKMQSRPPLDTASADLRSVVELVLAEVLNNVVEHAYAEAGGDIGLEIRLAGDRICFRIKDQGRALPELTLPQGVLADVAAGEFPEEGGYGWFMIRQFAQDLCYQRQDGTNLLTFNLSVKQ